MMYWNRRGFSLLEVMLTLVLVSAGTVAVVELFQRARMGGTQAENVLTATYLAQRRLEELRNTAYDDLDEAEESETQISTPSGYGWFRRQVEVTEPQTNLRQVVVTITWDAPGGEAEVSLQTYRSNT